MSARLTVVFDDEALYRRAKVYAAQHDRALKQVIEDALRSYLGDDPETGWFDPEWDVFDAWQADLRAAARTAPGADTTDLSDIKQHLYGHPPQEQRERMFAEEPTEYDAGR